MREDVGRAILLWVGRLWRRRLVGDARICQVLCPAEVLPLCRRSRGRAGRASPLREPHRHSRQKSGAGGSGGRGSSWQPFKAREHRGRRYPGSRSSNPSRAFAARLSPASFPFPFSRLHPPSSLPQEGCLATSSATRKRNGCDNYPQLRPNMMSTDLLSLSCLIPSAQEIIRQMFTARVPTQKAGI